MSKKHITSYMLLKDRNANALFLTCMYVCIYLQQWRAMDVLTIPSSLRSLPSLETSIEIHTGVAEGAEFESGLIPIDIATDRDSSEEKSSIPNVSRSVKYS